MAVDALASATAASSQSTSDAKKTLSGNFNTFLTLLTAQLSNQDPLNPVDSSQFTQQLVQYSQVEQQIETNDRLKSLLDQNGTASSAASVAYIGKTAVINSSVGALQNDGATWSYDTPNAVGAVTLSVLDSSGRKVFDTTKPASSGAQSFNWDGRDNNGRKLANGAYTLKIDAKDSSGAAVKPAVNVNEKITGIDFSGSTPQLITASGERAFDSLLTIRN